MTEEAQYPMRARCIDNMHCGSSLIVGAEYMVRPHEYDPDMYRAAGHGAYPSAGYWHYRFKPIVRVKMGRRVEGKT